jgi:transposase
MDEVEQAWDELVQQWNREEGLSGDETWVSLAEAESRAGVSRSALRSWYRNGHVPSRLIDGVHGPQRLVALEAVLVRAAQSPRIQHKAARALGVEAEVALLRDQVARLERRLEALEAELERLRGPQ